jgi:lysozyme
MNEKRNVLEWDPNLAKNIVKEYEGLRLKAYVCPAGVLTIGYGHARGVKRSDVITQADAERILEDDLVCAQDDLSTVVKVPITRGQFIGLLDLMFNLGLSTCRNYRIWGLVNSGDEKAASEKFLQYANSKVIDKQTNKPVLDENGKYVYQTLPGLLKRRQAEQQAFNS